jgi:hypothetical protein
MKCSPARTARIGARIARGSSIVLALAFASCNTNQSGKLAASGTGDVSAPPVGRVAPVDGGSLCVNLPAEGAGQNALARAPYLQRVTPHEAVVVWTSVAGGSASVLVQSPDGKQEASFAAAIDPAASAPGGDGAVTSPADAPAANARQWAAAVSGLEPDTAYCYTVYQDGVPVTAPAPLKSAPATGSAGRVQFVALGDSGGGGSDQRALLQQIESVPFDFMIHTGDIAYDNGTLADFESKFFGIYAPVLAARPMFPTSGNHDYETADAAPYRQVFVLPENGGDGGVERWYSYDWGNVHLVALDTERTGPIQAAWLEADLAANKLPWTIVYGHKPPHSSGEHGDDPAFNQYFVPILKAHHVQLVLSGHDHDYERFKPIDGITYIVTGGGGRGVRDLNTREAGSAFAEAVINCLVVTVEGDTLTVHAIDGTGREFDATMIPRQSS